MYAGRKEMPFFGKFVISSNDEENFAPVADEETRFWVNKVPVIEKDDPDLLQKMVEEVPAFLHYLSARPILHPKTGRHWFSYDLIETEAGKVVKEHSKGWLYSELKKLMEGQFAKYQWPTLYYSLDEIAILLNGPTGKGKYQTFDIHKTVTQKFNLSHTMRRHAFPFEPESRGQGPITYSKPPGRRYEFRVEDFYTEQEIKQEFGDIFKYEEIISSRGKAQPDEEPELGF